MNVLFFLIPKGEVSFVHAKDSIRQAMEKMEHHSYMAVPILSEEGRYIGTLTEGDLLWALKERNFPGLKEIENEPVLNIKRRRDNVSVNIRADIEDLLDKVENQNFVPVLDDDEIFIGIVTRKDIIHYLSDKCQTE